MKVLISHPHGNKNTKKVVSMLGKLNLLDSFWTTIAFPFRLRRFKSKFYNIRFQKIKLRFLKEFCAIMCSVSSFVEPSTMIMSCGYKDCVFTECKSRNNDCALM